MIANLLGGIAATLCPNLFQSSRILFFESPRQSPVSLGLKPIIVIADVFRGSTRPSSCIAHVAWNLTLSKNAVERPRKALLSGSPSTQQRGSAIEERDSDAPTPEDGPGDVEPGASDPAQAEGSGS
jgi:hypothetical protein